MALNILWLILFFLGILMGAINMFIGTNPSAFSDMIKAAFEAANSSFSLALGLTGVLALWMGIMKIGEKAGAVAQLSRLVSPLMRRVFPGIPPDHPAIGLMILNFTANILGLDNAATPAGVLAMKQMQTLNPDPERVTDDQAMFMVLHSASMTLVPVSIIAFRIQMKAANPADIFIPIVIASLFSVFGAFISAALVQTNIKVRDPILIAILGAGILSIVGFVWIVSKLPRDSVQSISSFLGSTILFGIIVWFLALASFRRLNAWELFIEGARDGFKVSIELFPFLLGVLVAVAVFRASGGMQLLVEVVWNAIAWTGLPKDVLGALPTMLMKPLSGAAARGMMIDAMKFYGVDSFTGRLACVFGGSTETTLYVVALYSGAIGLKNTRHVIPCSIVADLAGFFGAVVMALLFF